MLVRMISTQRGAMDEAGTICHQHKAGEVYDLPGFLAKVYIEAGFAKPEEAPEPAPLETAAAAPEEKAEDEPAEQPEPFKLGRRGNEKRK
jgi:hypothetical protein